MKKQKLKIGQAYKVTPRFADAVSAPYLISKMILYRGLVKSDRHNPREGDCEVEQHTFQVVGSDETIACDRGVSMRMLTTLFD